MKEEAAKLLLLIFEFIYSQALAIADFAKVTFANGSGFAAGFSSVWDAVYKIANGIIEPIAVFIVLIFFLMSLIEKVSTEQFTLESVLKDVIKLCLGLYLVTNSVEIVIGCIELGNAILTSIQNSGIVHRPTLEEMKNYLNVNGTDNPFMLLWSDFSNFVVTILVFVFFLIFFIIELIIMLAMQVVCLIRTLEIAIRTAMSPIALCDTFTGNILNSHAINFIRSFAALCMQGVFITVIAYSLPAFWAGLFNDAGHVFGLFGALTKMIVISLAAALLLFKSGSIAKEMLGAR